MFDYNHVCNLFLVKNNNSLCSHQKIHSKKLLALTKGISKVGYDLQIVIFNFCRYNLTKQEEYFYLKVCNLPFHPLKLNKQILCYILNYYIDMLSRKKFLVKILSFKHKLLDSATSSCAKIKSCRIRSNLNSDEAKALKIFN